MYYLLKACSKITLAFWLCLCRPRLRRIQAWRHCTSVHGLDAGKPSRPPPVSSGTFELSILGKLMSLTVLCAIRIYFHWLKRKDYSNTFDLTSIQFISGVPKGVNCSMPVYVSCFLKIWKLCCTNQKEFFLMAIAQSYEFSLQRFEFAGRNSGIKFYLVEKGLGE